jgi:hypothetical protein
MRDCGIRMKHDASPPPGGSASFCCLAASTTQAWTFRRDGFARPCAATPQLGGHRSRAAGSLFCQIEPADERPVFGPAAAERTVANPPISVSPAPECVVEFRGADHRVRATATGREPAGPTSRGSIAASPPRLDSQFISAESTKAAPSNVALLSKRQRTSVPVSRAGVAVRQHFRRSLHGAGGAAQVEPAKRSRARRIDAPPGRRRKAAGEIPGRRTTTPPAGIDTADLHGADPRPPDWTCASPR